MTKNSYDHQSALLEDQFEALWSVVRPAAGAPGPGLMSGLLSLPDVLTLPQLVVTARPWSHMAICINADDFPSHFAFLMWAICI